MSRTDEWNQRVIAEFRANEGRVGGPFDGAPMILVHHVGLRTGTVRVSPLVWFPDGERMLVVASKGGAPENPAWYHNLRAHPRVEVEVRAEMFTVEATEVRRDERDALWTGTVAQRPGFGGYQERTDRVIPVVALRRVA